MKPNRNTSAGTKADSTTTADDMQVSQTIAKPNVVCCALSELKKGDKVRIDHAHLYKDGYWQNWSHIDYIFLGKKGREYHFQNVHYEREHFRMKKNIEDNHVFAGRFA